ncbi:uncharacterized protein LOC116014814 [Ipomoea triloba]|uniref:uncharacterized protein LOC116014459 n=1 Tax=Ipomoea triloba TaxID=35885 RepID=UPI00125D6378|nr:uncharacterized protein LOC116014459 [Ipomoea triloba]XP_031110631.1 uncharacterized protein LOC116014814 [Ipomoea triloba]
MWIRRVERYFMISQTPPVFYLDYLTVNLSRKVEIWLEGYLSNLRGGFNWGHFVEAVCRRFGPGTVSIDEEFTVLKQLGGVEEFTDKFEEMRSMLLQVRPYLTDEYFLGNYVCRLKQVIRCFVRSAKPENLEDAIWLAKNFEQGVKSNEFFPKNSLQPRNSVMRTAENRVQDGPRINNTTRNVEMDKLREQRLCFNCKERWQYGHKCKPKGHMASAEGGEEDDIQEQDQANPTPLSEECVEEAEVSLNAVVGGEGINTIKLPGSILKRDIIILVDSGSTHSFVDPALTHNLRLKAHKVQPLVVTIANGERLLCDEMSGHIEWIMQGESFRKSFRVMKLGGCDMLLGMDWIDLFAPTELHTRPLSISFHKDGRRIKLKGITPKKGLLEASKKEVKNWQRQGVKGFLVSCIEKELQGNSYNIEVTRDPLVLTPTKIEETLSEFSELFQEPKSLPPTRACDHTVSLIPNPIPVNKGPYRYSFEQKNIIERMVDEMLQTGIIRPSSSPFASPVLLVPKKDSTWRFCVDYRALNAITIKNKYPIPIVEDLFSELAGSRFFSKVDLRSGYHQVRMREGKEYKTAFKTHQGLFEFTVMPFGLTNAPATFQALMNSVFKPLLRRSVLVFFDDILIYSPNFEEHLQHLRAVFKIMREQHLYAKLSKCSFAQHQIEYLGHIISVEGLQTDPEKIKAVMSWPKPNTVTELRGFLGLTGYYRTFVKGYGSICKPLTNLLKKNAFSWDQAADIAFEELKQALCTAPVLALPNFDLEFVVESDACHKGMGAVLMQEGRPIAYYSQGFNSKHLGLFIYEKEYLSIINAVDKWRAYLIGRHFVIKTDHQSLKFLLEQKITTALQQKG